MLLNNNSKIIEVKEYNRKIKKRNLCCFFRRFFVSSTISMWKKKTIFQVNVMYMNSLVCVLLFPFSSLMLLFRKSESERLSLVDDLTFNSGCVLSLHATYTAHCRSELMFLKPWIYVCFLLSYYVLKLNKIELDLVNSRLPLIYFRCYSFF